MMRIATLFLFLSLFVFPAAAQTETRLNQCPAAFRTFYSGFLKAVRSGEKAKVATMTRFPFRWGFDAGDEGSYSRAEFNQNFSQLFGEDSSELMPERNPLCSADKDGVAVTSEDALVLQFVRSGKTYKLSSYIVLP